MSTFDPDEPFLDWQGAISDQLDWATGSDAENDEVLANAFDEIESYNAERRRYHDTASYFAECAWSEQCLALGHQRDPEAYDEDGTYLDTEDQLYADDEHCTGWNGDTICRGTRFGVACSQCEGECDYQAVGPNLWEMVAGGAR